MEGYEEDLARLLTPEDNYEEAVCYGLDLKHSPQAECGVLGCQPMAVLREGGIYGSEAVWKVARHLGL